jgi:hypothetical protein
MSNAANAERTPLLVRKHPPVASPEAPARGDGDDADGASKASSTWAQQQQKKQARSPKNGGGASPADVPPSTPPAHPTFRATPAAAAPVAAVGRCKLKALLDP